MVGVDGLSLQSFLDGSPYQGEDLIMQPASPERFLTAMHPPTLGDARDVPARAARGGPDITVRFPRAWLDDWRTAADGIDRLIASFRPTLAPG